jgi:hypothetical protein
MIEDLTEGKLIEALIFAHIANNNTLIDCLYSLSIWNKNESNQKRTTKVYNDFSPYSFSFARYIDDRFVSNGGIIFHGKHDKGGDGSSPTFSVSLTPTDGWQIHT